MSFEILPCPPERMAEMAQVQAQVMQSPVSAQALARKYQHGGDGGPGLALLILHNGRPVGCTGAIPFRYVDPSGAPVLAAQPGDFALLPEFRGAGVFAEAMRLLEERMRDAGAQLSFGYCNEGSLKVLTRVLEHEVWGALDVFELVLSQRSGLLARISDRARRSLGWRAGACHEAPEPLWRGGDPRGAWGAERGAAFVQARRATGCHFVSVAGHAVLVRPGVATKVALPETLDPAEVPAVLAEVAVRARRAGARILRITLSDRDPAHAPVRAAAGPALGQVMICAKADTPALPLSHLRFGYADYENF